MKGGLQNGITETHKRQMLQSLLIQKEKRQVWKTIDIHAT